LNLHYKIFLAEARFLFPPTGGTPDTQLPPQLLRALPRALQASSAQNDGFYFAGERKQNAFRFPAKGRCSLLPRVRDVAELQQKCCRTPECNI
jgi:hypothetical protein